MSFCVIFLLITSRSRWLPASGAMVKPVFLTFFTRFISFGVNVPARRDGKETAIRLGCIPCHQIFHERKNTAHNPLYLKIKERCPHSRSKQHEASERESSVSKDRSRTGRYIIPAWQKRHPWCIPLIFQSEAIMNGFTIWNDRCIGKRGMCQDHQQPLF